MTLKSSIVMAVVIIEQQKKTFEFEIPNKMRMFNSNEILEC